jgi:hypothetical protein
MKILLTAQVTTPTCVYIHDFLDQNSTCIRMSGLPYRLTNTMPHWHGTKTNDYVKTANERMVEQTQKVNVIRRPFVAEQLRRHTCNQRPLQLHHSPKHTGLVLTVNTKRKCKTDPIREQQYALMCSVSWRDTVLLLFLLLVLRIRTFVLTFSRSL